MPKMDLDALIRFLEQEFPQVLAAGMRIERVDDEGVELVLPTRDAHLRPGGTISGPTLMTLADSATYLTILSRVGPVALAVTSSLEIHFLRRPPPGEVRAVARLLKLGRRLAIATVEMTCPGVDGPVAHATVTYALPAK